MVAKTASAKVYRKSIHNGFAVNFGHSVCECHEWSNKFHGKYLIFQGFQNDHEKNSYSTVYMSKAISTLIKLGLKKVF